MMASRETNLRHRPSGGSRSRSRGTESCGSREASDLHRGSSGGDVLPLYQLERLAEHKYSAQGVSLLEPLLQPFWRTVVEWLPLWIAPNTLTLIGLIVNAATTLILVLYCPRSVGEAPSWAYFLCAGGLFMYQTLDAIDGKQARRTNTSSPLGELFDHGCDALSIVFVAVGTCICAQLGTHPKLMFGECFASMFVYYSAHWQTYCSSTLQFGYMDVTEAQVSIISMYIATGLFGADIWNIEISEGYPLKLLPAAASIAGGLWSLKCNLGVIFVDGGVGKNGSTVAGSSVVSPIIPIATLLGAGTWLAVNSPSRLFERHSALYVISFGLSAAKLTNKLVVAHMSRSEMSLMDSAFISPALLVLNLYLNIQFNEFYLLCFCTLFALVDLIVYCIQVCKIICQHMNIHCFSITPPTSSSKPIRTQQSHH